MFCEAKLVVQEWGDISAALLRTYTDVRFSKGDFALKAQPRRSVEPRRMHALQLYKIKKRAERKSPCGTLVVQEFENVCVCSGVFLFGHRKPLCRFVACCLLLVACCLLQNCVGRVIVCQVLCAAFMHFCVRMCITAIGAFGCHRYVV